MPFGFTHPVNNLDSQARIRPEARGSSQLRMITVIEKSKERCSDRAVLESA